MPERTCEPCAFRVRYDRNPRSLLGRLWRWHTGRCPGWKAYVAGLPEDRRAELARRCDMPRYKGQGARAQAPFHRARARMNA